ncbi:MAG: ABC transporter permease [Bacteroidales bacterium]|nr:ABC transporter permease [Bacteroidales bacterium]
MSLLKFYINTARKLLRNEDNKFSRPIVSISIAGVALGIVVMIIAIAITTGYKQVIREKVVSMGSHIRISNYDMNYSFEPVPFDKNQDFVEEIRRMPQVQSLQCFSTKSGVIKTKDQVEGIVLKGIDDTFDTTHFQQNMLEGTFLNVNDTVPSKEILISKTMSQRLKLNIGDKVRTYFVQDPPMQRNFIVVGIYETGLPEYDKQFALVDLRQVQKLNQWDSNMVGGMEILLRDFNEIDDLGEQIDGKVGYKLKAETIKQIFPEIFQWIALFDTNVVVLLIITFFVCLITMMSTFFIIVIEQTSAIGILKTLGMKTKAVVRLFIAIASNILIRGLIWGNVLAFAIGLAQQQWHWVKLDAATYYVAYVPIQFNIPMILGLNLGVFVLCVAALTIPAYVVARKISPLTAIKFD